MDESVYNYFKMPISLVLEGSANSFTWEALGMLGGEQVQQIYFWLARKLECLEWLLMDSPIQVSLQNERVSKLSHAAKQFILTSQLRLIVSHM